MCGVRPGLGRKIGAFECEFPFDSMPLVVVLIKWPEQRLRQDVGKVPIDISASNGDATTRTPRISMLTDGGSLRELFNQDTANDTNKEQHREFDGGGKRNGKVEFEFLDCVSFSIYTTRTHWLFI